MFQTNHRTIRTARPRSHAGGFTLIELLVVITIIAVLMTLVVQAVGAFIGQARSAATETTIRKINGLLADRAETLHRMNMRNGYLESTLEYASPAGNASKFSYGDVNLRKILANKELKRHFFPQRLADVRPDLQPNVATNMSPTEDSTTSSELLYDFLTQANVLGSEPIGADTFSPAEATDKDGDGFPEFIDAWGNPLRFYRWPTRLFRRNPYWKDQTTVNPIDATDFANARVLLSTIPSYTGNPNVDLSRDPDDPLRKCTIFNPNITGTSVYKIDFEDLGYHTPATYHVLLVVSAGPDGDLGLYEPYDVANKGHLANVRDQNALYDDISYLNVRAGGK